MFTGAARSFALPLKGFWPQAFLAGAGLLAAACFLARRCKRADAGRFLAKSTAAGASLLAACFLARRLVCWRLVFWLGAASAPMLEGMWLNPLRQELVYWHGAAERAVAGRVFAISAAAGAATSLLARVPRVRGCWKGCFLKKLLAWQAEKVSALPLF